MTDFPTPDPAEDKPLHIGSNGPECPHCGATVSAVKDSRPYRADKAMTRRRRECFTCEQRFTTYESTVQTIRLPPALRHHLIQVRDLCTSVLESATKGIEVD